MEDLSLPRVGETAREKPLLAPRSRPWSASKGNVTIFPCRCSPRLRRRRGLGCDAADGHALVAPPLEFPWGARTLSWSCGPVRISTRAWLVPWVSGRLQFTYAQVAARDLQSPGAPGEAPSPRRHRWPLERVLPSALAPPLGSGCSAEIHPVRPIPSNRPVPGHRGGCGSRTLTEPYAIRSRRVGKPPRN